MLVIPVIVVLGAVTVVAARLVWPLFGPTRIPPVSYGGELGVPGQVLLKSLRSKPTAGWTVDLKALLPDAGEPHAEYVGHVGDRGYFAVEDFAPRGAVMRTWLLGVDVARGTTLFAPVEIGEGQPDCFVNGRHRMVCLSSVRGNPDMPADLHDIFVVDTDAGALIAHEPSPYDGKDPHFEVAQVGDYAVASRRDAGVYGIGDDGKPTWFVEGDGLIVSPFSGKRFATDPSTDLAEMDDGKGRRTVFSAADGTKVAAAVDGRVELFTGGFVVDNRTIPESFRFHDQRGTVVGEYQASKHAIGIVDSNGQLPWITFNFGGRDETQLVFDTRGTPMAVVQARLASSGATRFLGTHLYAGPAADSDDPKAVWDKFDLRTGERVSSCAGMPLGRSAFLGSDGTVVLGRFYHPRGDDPLIAVDTDDCTVLWQIDKPAPMWVVGSTLVQASPRADKITSLVPRG